MSANDFIACIDMCACCTASCAQTTFRITNIIICVIALGIGSALGIYVITRDFDSHSAPRILLAVYIAFGRFELFNFSLITRQLFFHPRVSCRSWIVNPLKKADLDEVQIYSLFPHCFSWDNDSIDIPRHRHILGYRDRCWSCYHHLWLFWNDSILLPVYVGIKPL